MSDDGSGFVDRASESGINRRQLMKLAGAATAAGASLTAAGTAFAAQKGAAEEVAAAEAAAFEAKVGRAQDSNAKATAISWLDNNAGKVMELNDEVWENSELSLREWDSALAHARILQRHGFEIDWHTSGLPAAFIATWSNGRGGPAIGFNAEYDALPGISQKAGVGIHEPRHYGYDPYAPEYGAGHGCGHSALGAASTGAALAAAHALKRHRVPGSVVLYGSTGEEQLVGKVYAARAGAYDGLDAFIDWHPSGSNGTGWGSSSAMYSAAFTFLGQTSHGGSPFTARGSLTAVQMLVTLLEFLREKDVPSSARLHWAIPNAGSAPNVITDIATLWCYTREATPERAKFLLDKAHACARAAAEASRTELHMRINTGCWNTLGNRAGAELMHENMVAIGGPPHTARAQTLAKQIQKELGIAETGMSTTVGDLAPPAPFPEGGSSTDMGDVSWIVPRVSMSAAVWIRSGPGHHWANAATSGSDAGRVASVTAAKYMAACAIDLYTQPAVLKEVKDEFAERTKDRKWSTMLPAGTEPPVYEPPPSFLRKTGADWPPSGVTWPPAKLIARMPLNSSGPPRPPVT